MPKLKSSLGYTGAALTVAGAALIPFVLIDVFTRGFAATGVRTAPVFSGGEPSYTLERPGYGIVVNRPVRKSVPLQRLEPFVQLTWTPVTALPKIVYDEVDIDNDGIADAKVRFAVPTDRKRPLRAEVETLTPALRPVKTITRESFSSVIARVGNGIIVRIPLAQ